MRPTENTWRLTHILMGVLCLGVSGCGLLDILAGLTGVDNPQALTLPPNAILVEIDNQSGMPVSVDALFFLSKQDVRRTTRLLDPTGDGAILTLVRTAAERFEVSARIADRGQAIASGSPLFQPGHVLFNGTFVRLVDYQPGDTVAITILGPPADCDENGESDLEEIAAGAMSDCDDNEIPDFCQADTDDDGMIDACDNCVNRINSEQDDADGDGIGDTCDTVACCFADGACSDQMAGDCLAAGGLAQGPGTDCKTADCPLPKVACCLSEGACEEMTANECDSREGAYEEGVTTCDEAVCIVPVLTGACCFGFRCSDLTEVDCEEADGEFQGVGTHCIINEPGRGLDSVCPMNDK